jgi:hypothetical protein
MLSQVTRLLASLFAPSPQTENEPGNPAESFSGVLSLLVEPEEPVGHRFMAGAPSRELAARAPVASSFPGTSMPSDTGARRPVMTAVAVNPLPMPEESPASRSNQPSSPPVTAVGLDATPTLNPDATAEQAAGKVMPAPDKAPVQESRPPASTKQDRSESRPAGPSADPVVHFDMPPAALTMPPAALTNVTPPSPPKQQIATQAPLHSTQEHSAPDFDAPAARTEPPQVLVPELDSSVSNADTHGFPVAQLPRAGSHVAAGKVSSAKPPASGIGMTGLASMPVVATIQSPIQISTPPLMPELASPLSMNGVTWSNLHDLSFESGVGPANDSVNVSAPAARPQYHPNPVWVPTAVAAATPGQAGELAFSMRLKPLTARAAAASFTSNQVADQPDTPASNVNESQSPAAVVASGSLFDQPAATASVDLSSAAPRAAADTRTATPLDNPERPLTPLTSGTDSPADATAAALPVSDSLETGRLPGGPSTQPAKSYGPASIPRPERPADARTPDAPAQNHLAGNAVAPLPVSGTQRLTTKIEVPTPTPERQSPGAGATVSGQELPTQARPGPAARSLQLDLNSAGERVAVRLAERDGTVHVDVRTSDNRLASTLREDLPELTARMEQTGFQAEAWHPAAASTTDRLRAPAAAAAENMQDQRQGSGQQSQEQDRSRDSNSGQQSRQGKQGRKDFQWLFTSIR